MHDAVSGERLGIPSTSIITERFVSAAELMAQVLGADGHKFVEIGHPISSQTKTQLSQAAAAAAHRCAALLTSS